MDDARLPSALNTAIEEAEKIALLSSLLPAVTFSPELSALLEKGLLGASLPPALKTSRAAQAFQQAFELIGGVPRLALWADQNPSKFYTLFSKMIPATALIQEKKDITITVKYSNPNFNQGHPPEPEDVLTLENGPHE
jgi:hypothetical protein